MQKELWNVSTEMHLIMVLSEKNRAGKFRLKKSPSILVSPAGTADTIQ